MKNKDTQTEAKPLTAVEMQRGVMPHCTTHHHACKCREYMTREVLRGVIEDLEENGTPDFDQMYVDLNELYLFLYENVA